MLLTLKSDTFIPLVGPVHLHLSRCLRLLLLPVPPLSTLDEQCSVCSGSDALSRTTPTTNFVTGIVNPISSIPLSMSLSCCPSFFPLSVPFFRHHASFGFLLSRPFIALQHSCLRSFPVPVRSIITHHLHQSIHRLGPLYQAVHAPFSEAMQHFQLSPKSSPAPLTV